MSDPRHLWSGDWQLESAARADELAAARRNRPEEAPEPEPPAPPRRPRGAWIRALRQRLRNLPRPSRRHLRVGLAIAALALLTAGAALALSSALGGSSGTTQAATVGSRAWLGIDVSTSPLGGVMVVDVFPGGPAQAAGMEPGDVITQLNGKRVLSPSDVTSAIAAMHPGQRVQIQFQGSGTAYASSVALATRPAGYP